MHPVIYDYSYNLALNNPTKFYVRTSTSVTRAPPDGPNVCLNKTAQLSHAEDYRLRMAKAWAAGRDLQEPKTPGHGHEGSVILV